ncbi:MAG: gp436 family protein [Nitrincola lacisaponensis]|uniref:gp436 family protein n=1 Tax=Nitrincola lacisaponensis TaxID=267850 RepID=UPI00391963EF
MQLYATTQDMINRYGQDELVLLTDRDGSLGAIADLVLDQALADASAEIDGYLGGRYQLPLPTVPAVLTRICCDIARYLLHDEQAPEQLQKRYESSIKFLRSLGNGELSLGLPDTGSAGPSNNTAEMHSHGSVFARDKSKGFI